MNDLYSILVSRLVSSPRWKRSRHHEKTELMNRFCNTIKI